MQMRTFNFMFKGRNGIGAIATPIGSVKFFERQAKVIYIQQVFASISASTVTVANGTGSFDTDLDTNGNLQQNTSSDFSDVLFLACVELP
jgi:hypothetical protein